MAGRTVFCSVTVCGVWPWLFHCAGSSLLCSAQQLQQCRYKGLPVCALRLAQCCSNEWCMMGMGKQRLRMQSSGDGAAKVLTDCGTALNTTLSTLTFLTGAYHLQLHELFKQQCTTLNNRPVHASRRRCSTPCPSSGSSAGVNAPGCGESEALALRIHRQPQQRATGPGWAQLGVHLLQHTWRVEFPVGYRVHRFSGLACGERERMPPAQAFKQHHRKVCQRSCARQTAEPTVELMVGCIWPGMWARPSAPTVDQALRFTRTPTAEQDGRLVLQLECSWSAGLPPCRHRCQLCYKHIQLLPSTRK